MDIQFAFHALRRYGVRGVVDFLRDLSHRKSVSRRLAKSLITNPVGGPQPGITVVGEISKTTSLSKVLRDFIIRLRGCGIPCQAFDTGCGAHIPEAEYASLLTPQAEFRLNRYSDIVGMFALPSLPPMACRLSRIGFWEFESGLLANCPGFRLPLEVVTMSDFAQMAFRNQVAAEIPVTKILYPFTFTPGHLIASADIRARHGLGAHDFVVFYNFSYLSSYHRKNPEGALRAFAEAFASCADAKLVFKTMGAKKAGVCAAQLRALVQALGLSDRVVFIDDYVPQDELIALTNACDVYLSLHRGEGFGLGIAEAMSLGKPVVVTDYSAPTEFCNADNALLVPYRMVPVEIGAGDVEIYRHVTEWPEPDIHAAAQALRRLYDDRAFAMQLGEKGRRFIADHFSDANFKASVEAFLARRR